MTADIIGLRAAAEQIGIIPATLAYWLDVGDLLPEKGIVTWAQHDGTVWPDFKKMVFTVNAIERYWLEKNRRSFLDFKTEYADIYRPTARGLDFGPGWEGLLRTYADELRDLVRQGRPAWLKEGKEKWGALRLYADHMPSAEAEVIQLHKDAIKSSLGICQECGEPGRLR